MEAHLVLFVSARHAGKRPLDDERTEMFPVDLGEDDVEVGEAAIGDPHLLAVQDEAAVGRARRSSTGSERVRARSRLAQTIRADQLARHQSREVLPLLAFAAKE